MQVNIEFNQQLMPQNVIELKEIGEFAIEATNDDGMYYYLVVKTKFGNVTIASCGPVIPEIMQLPNGFTQSVCSMQYKEDKLQKFISTWLNDRSKKLTDAKTIDIDSAVYEFRDLKRYLETTLDSEEIADVDLGGIL